jgi:hypothetical protein
MIFKKTRETYLKVMLWNSPAEAERPQVELTEERWETQPRFEMGDSEHRVRTPDLSTTPTYELAVLHSECRPTLGKLPRESEGWSESRSS